MDVFDPSVVGGGTLGFLSTSAFDFLCVHQSRISAAVYLDSIEFPEIVFREIQGWTSNSEIQYCDP
jgi:hypothetical protein